MRKGTRRIGAVALGFVLLIGLPVTAIAMVICKLACKDFLAPVYCAIFLWRGDVAIWFRVRALECRNRDRNQREMADEYRKLLNGFDIGDVLAILSNVPHGAQILNKIVLCGDESKLPDFFRRLAHYDGNGNELVRLLEKKDGCGQPLLHRAVNSRVDSLLVILPSIYETLSLDQRKHLTEIKDSYGDTFLHYFRDDKIGEILNILQQQGLPLYEICNIRNRKNQTILHSIAGCPDSLFAVAALLRNDEVKDLALVQDEDGNTFLHIALERFITCLCASGSRPVAKAGLLRQLVTLCKNAQKISNGKTTVVSLMEVIDGMFPSL